MKAAFVLCGAKQAESHPEGVALVAVTSAGVFLAPPRWGLRAHGC